MRTAAANQTPARARPGGHPGRASSMATPWWAIRRNAVLKAHHDALVTRGPPKKVSLIA